MKERKEGEPITQKLVMLERISALASGIIEQVERWGGVGSRDELLALQEMLRSYGIALRSADNVLRAIKAQQGAQS